MNVDGEGPLEVVWSNVWLEAGLPCKLDQVAVGLLQSHWKISEDRDPQSLGNLPRCLLTVKFLPPPSFCNL